MMFLSLFIALAVFHQAVFAVEMVDEAKAFYTKYFPLPAYLKDRAANANQPVQASTQDSVQYSGFFTDAYLGLSDYHNCTGDSKFLRILRYPWQLPNE